MTYVIGTAGHVDHGKSALVRALTGIDPDRLPEEQARGLTTDLGFAWFTLPSGRDVSVVDVPGHERFVKHMLAGAGGFDLALLIVAADEGVGRQTREHLAILDVLGVRSLLAVVTKRDLVDDDALQLVTLEVEELLSTTRFAGAPAVAVSSRTGAGLPDLLAAIDAALDRIPPRPDLGRPRLAIDRAFAVRGFGTVVTGTLVGGALAVGQEIEVQPGGLRARIRGLERHGQSAERLKPGTRAAVNIAGLSLDEVRRGMVLALPGTIAAATSAAVRLEAVRDLDAPLRRSTVVTFLSGTAETQARLRILGDAPLAASEGAWATVTFAEPLPLAEDDRCVIRTPNATAAGGVVVMLDPPRRQARATLLARLEGRTRGPVDARALARLVEGPLPLDALAAALGLPVAAIEASVDALVARGDAVQAEREVYATRWLDAKGERLRAAIVEALAQRPLRAAVPREAVRVALGGRDGLARPAFTLVLARAVAAGEVVEGRDQQIATVGYAVTLSPAQAAEVAAFLDGLRRARVAPAGALSEPDLLAHLVETGRVEAVGEFAFDPQAFAAMRAQVVAHLEARGAIALPEARDLLGVSRRQAQALLERLDAVGLTRREGDTRVLVR